MLIANEIHKLLKNLKINQLLRVVNNKKLRGISGQQIFEFIFLLVLFGKDQYRFLETNVVRGYPRKMYTTIS